MIGLQRIRRKPTANWECLHGHSCLLHRARLPLQTLILSVFLLLQGCAGFYTSHPVADLETSAIDERFLGSWKLRIEGNKPSWIARFSSEDMVTGKLVLLRYDRKQSDYIQTNAVFVRCLRKGDTGVCSAELDHNPIPTVKESAGGFTFDFSTMRAPNADWKHVVAYYEIRQSGDVAVYADTDLDKLKQLVAEENIASISKPFMVTEPTEGLMRFLSGRANTLFEKKPTVMRNMRKERLDEKLDRLKKELVSPLPHYAYNAALQLGGLGKQAASAVPDLTEILWQWLESEAAVDEAVVRGAIVALGKIGVSTPETLAALAAAWKFGYRELREKIDKTLEALEREVAE